MFGSGRAGPSIAAPRHGSFAATGRTAAVTTSVTHLGGIIEATANAVGADSTKARAVFEATAVAHDAVASTVTLGRYHVEVDEPPPLGGEAKAPNPVEYYLASLLSCQIVTWRFWAEKLGIAVDSITARAEGDLDVRGFFGLEDAAETVRAGFQEVRVVIRVSGPDTAKRYRELQDAVDAHCPVLDLTRNPTPVVTRVEIG
ncbi:MAG: OsmC family peroxiredoxin [Mycobacterium sp.]|nr:MAG: OsmC family peroxiredoxin [Mycobacterium sp.]